MTIEMWREMLLWCTLLNVAVLIFWFFLYVFGRRFVRSVHGRWFAIPPEQIDAVQYLLMGIYRLAIIVFCLMPLIALHIMR